MFKCEDCVHNHCQLCVGCREIFPPRNFKDKLVIKAEYTSLKLEVEELRKENEDIKLHHKITDYMCDILLEKLREEKLKVEQLQMLACEKCKLTKMAFGCRIGNTYCRAFKK